MPDCRSLTQGDLKFFRSSLVLMALFDRDIAECLATKKHPKFLAAYCDQVGGSTLWVLIKGSIVIIYLLSGPVWHAPSRRIRLF